MMKKPFFALLAFIFAHTLPAQSPEWTVFRSPEKVNDFADMGDFFWLATGNGVSRLQKDGLSAELWTPQNSALPSGHIQSLATDLAGTAWIGTYDGEIARFDGGEWITLPLPEEVKPGTEQDRLYFVEFDDQNRLWVGNNAGLHRFDGQQWTTWNHATTGEFISDVWDLAISPEGKVYFVSFFIYELDGDQLTNLSGNNFELVSYSDAYLRLLDGELWFSSLSHTLARYSGGEWEIFPMFDPALWNGVLPGEVRNMVFDPQGELVLNTGNGFFSLEDGVWSHFTTVQSQLAGQDVDLLHFDENGTSWAFFGSKVSRLDEEGSMEQGLIADLNISHNEVRGLVEGPDGELLVLTGNSTVDQYLNGTWTSFWTPADTFSQFPSIAEMEADDAGNLWLSTIKGLYMWNGQAWSKDAAYPFTTVSRLATGAGGQLWACTANEVAWYDGQSWKKYNASNSPLSGNSFKDMVADHNDVLWITTYQRELFRLENGQWQVFTPANSIIPDDYWSGAMTVDVQNRLWISLGYNGLLSIDGNQWAIIPAEEIPGEGNSLETYIYSLDIDKNGVFYLVRYQTLTVWNSQTGEWSQYNAQNSPLDAFISNLFFDSENRLWIATYHGLLMRQPDMVSSDQNPQANQAFALRVFPNPAADRLAVEWPEKTNDGATLLVLDAAGRTVRVLAPPAGSKGLQVDISGLPSGLYYLQHIDGRKREAVKWVKR